jgi:hypothetical protein
MKSTSRFGMNKKGIICLNCEQPISDKDYFCSNCGQVNDTSRLSLKTYFSEYLAGFFSFDNRFLKTVFPLIFKPGKVTKEYVEGKRMRYVNPFQLYINVSIIFFLILGLLKTIESFTSIKNYEVNTVAINDSIKSETLAELKKNKPLNILSLDSDIDSISKSDSLATPLRDDSSETAKETQIKIHLDSIFKHTNILIQLNSSQITPVKKDSIFNSFYEKNLEYMLNLYNDDENITIDNWQNLSGLNQIKQFSLNHIQTSLEKNNIAYEIPETYKSPLQDEFLEKMAAASSFTKLNKFITYGNKNKDVNVLKALDDLGYEKTNWNIFYYNKSQNFSKLINDESYRKEYLNTMVSRISVALFFLLPIFTLVLGLFYIQKVGFFYIKNKYFYTEHLVFVFHQQTVFFLLFLLFYLVDRIFNTNIGMIAFFTIFPIHLFKSMRKFYAQGKFITTLKFIILNLLFVVFASIGAIIISFLGFLF